MKIIKKLTVVAVVLVVMVFAFRLSFDAQTKLAHGAGLDLDMAWNYPFVVDAAIAGAYLIRTWFPNLAPHIKIYLWVAIGIWTATSILGNAIHIDTLGPDQVTIAYPIAVAVNTVPGVTLFMLLHLSASATEKASEPTVTAQQEQPRSPKPRPTKPGTSSAEPTVTDEVLEDMLRRWDNGSNDGESFAAIALSMGRSKSWVGKTIKREVERRREAEVRAA